MPESDAKTSLIGGLFSLSEVIKYASIAAAIYAQWTVMSKEINDLQAMAQVEASARIQLQRDLNAVEIEQAKDDIRFENLRDIVIELRRQAGLRTPLPPSGP